MKYSVTLIAAFLLAFSVNSQTKALPLTYHGAQIFSLLAPVGAYEVVETRDMSKSATKYTVRTFSDRMELILNWNTSAQYDAILTRDGINIQYVRLKNVREEPQGTLVNMAGPGVDMYFLSQPMKRYTVVGQKNINQFDFNQSFVALSNELLGVKFKMEYQAVIVGVDVVSYVVY